MYICPLDDHLLLTLGYDSVLLQSTSEIFFKQRNPYHTLFKKKYVEFSVIIIFYKRGRQYSKFQR